jgi:hypothetical protein
MEHAAIHLVIVDNKSAPSQKQLWPAGTSLSQRFCSKSVHFALANGPEKIIFRKPLHYKRYLRFTVFFVLLYPHHIEFHTNIYKFPLDPEASAQLWKKSVRLHGHGEAIPQGWKIISPSSLESPQSTKNDS